jgi:hypothetical protein
MRNRLKFNVFLREVIPATIGGVVIGKAYLRPTLSKNSNSPSFLLGAVNWVLLATFGNGSMVFSWTVKNGFRGLIPKKLLPRTGFARTVDSLEEQSFHFHVGIITIRWTVHKYKITVTRLDKGKPKLDLVHLVLEGLYLVVEEV